MTDEELKAIEERAAKAVDVAGAPGDALAMAGPAEVRLLIAEVRRLRECVVAACSQLQHVRGFCRDENVSDGIHHAEADLHNALDQT